MPLSAQELARYSRHILLSEIGRDGQERLRAGRVVVVGAGGLGSPALLYLAAAGVGTLGLIDGDAVDLSNLQRQVLYDTGDVAQAKTSAAQRRLTALNPDIAVVAHAVELSARNACDILSGYDVVVDGCDRLGTRYLVNDACVLLRKPLVSAAIHKFEGQALTYLPDRGPCYRCLFPAPPQDGIPTCAQAGVLGVLPGVLGAIQAAEAIKILLGVGELLVGRLLTFDALDMRFQEFPFQRREDCPVCGDQPTITRLEERNAAPEPTATAIRRLSPEQLNSLIRAASDRGPRPVIVDVRDTNEFDVGHVAGAINIPLTELDGRTPELAAGEMTVFVCRSGRRSEHACGIAARHGLANVAHLEGGLLAWRESVDRSLLIA
jgi:adenylyltransferase/sulfurtransferase